MVTETDGTAPTEGGLEELIRQGEAQFSAEQSQNNFSSTISNVVVSSAKIERLLLLANAQAVIVAKERLGNGGGGKVEPPLDDSTTAVEFAIARLCAYS